MLEFSIFRDVLLFKAWVGLLSKRFKKNVVVIVWVIDSLVSMCLASFFDRRPQWGLLAASTWKHPCLRGVIPPEIGSIRVRSCSSAAAICQSYSRSLFSRNLVHIHGTLTFSKSFSAAWPGACLLFTSHDQGASARSSFNVLEDIYI